MKRKLNLLLIFTLSVFVQLTAQTYKKTFKLITKTDLEKPVFITGSIKEIGA